MPASDRPRDSATEPPAGNGDVVAISKHFGWHRVAAESVRQEPTWYTQWRPLPVVEPPRVRATRTEPPTGGYVLVWHAATGIWVPGLSAIVAAAPERHSHWLPMPPAPEVQHAEA